MIAKTPEPPYYAVIFTSRQTQVTAAYEDMAARMFELASRQEGYLGMESVREELTITVSYWRDLASIKHWKANADHLAAQVQGRKIWYRQYKTRICKVERDYEFDRAHSQAEFSNMISRGMNYE